MPGTMAQIMEDGKIVVVEVIDRTATGATIVREDGTRKRKSLDTLRRAINEAWKAHADELNGSKVV
jgi:hypothetical protein